MTSGNNPVVVGVAGPLSGPRTAHAPLLHRATACLQQHGIGWRLEDDGADPVMAVAVARRMIAQGVTAVIGHFNSACAAAVLPLYRQHGIALLLPASSQTGLCAGGGAFRLCSTDLAQAGSMRAAMDAMGLGLWPALGLGPAPALAAASACAPDAVDIATDGSPYAQRVLGALVQTGWPTPLHPVGIHAAPAPGARLRLVLATCASALEANRMLVASAWNGSVIYSDDAHVDAFFDTAARRSGLHQRVIGSQRDYGELVDDCCALVARWQALGAGQPLPAWLAASGRFSDDGDALDAGWQLETLS